MLVTEMFSALFVLGLVLAAFLAFGSGKLGRLAILVTAAGIAILAVFTISYALNVYSTEQLIGSYVDNIAQAAGLSPYITKVITVLLTLPALGAFAWCFSASQRKRLTGRYALAGLTSAYFAALWFATSDQKITREGDVIKCFIVNEDRVVWLDIKFVGLDPVTGRPCEIPKPSMLSVLAKLDDLLRSGRELQPIDPAGRFFNSIGDPTVWYHERERDNFEFYEAPGYDPLTGQRLLPVTKVVVDRLESRKRELEKIAADKRLAEAVEINQKAERVRQKQEMEAIALAKRQEEERLESMRGLVVGGTVENAEASLGLAIVPNRSGDPLDKLAAVRLANELASAAPENLRVFATMFAPGFVEQGHFANVLSGGTSSLDESAAFSRARRVVLGTVRAACGETNSVDGMKTCVISFSYRAYGKSGVLVSSDTLSETGPGFSDEKATLRGVELLVERKSKNFFEATR